MKRLIAVEAAVKCVVCVNSAQLLTYWHCGRDEKLINFCMVMFSRHRKRMKTLALHRAPVMEGEVLLLSRIMWRFRHKTAGVRKLDSLGDTF